MSAAYFFEISSLKLHFSYACEPIRKESALYKTKSVGAADGAGEAGESGASVSTLQPAKSSAHASSRIKKLLILIGNLR